ncbi:T9SS type A sorting domain-containing protein [Chryseobacterium sp. MP_3.2]|uniref:T9SS type A sorting domain-containing protein n=1 Tax=Chryseobacterium sp. MP_3.2 TaxID=3071712 RepID=UPI002E0C1311|nr:hypothetical protein [Chryseobacterium sp. MP_3.2]
MRKLKILAVICLAPYGFGQTIDFKGCIPLFENQTYTFTKSGDDAFGKKIYITTPITGDQDCGGLGTCEFKLQWNNTNSRWEFLADSGNGDFVNPFLIYYNATGNSAAINPPSISVGTWVENSAVTNGECAGNLTNANATMTGDVHTTVLALNEFDNIKITIYPNPATEYINIIGLENIKSVKIIAADGKIVSKTFDSAKIDISKTPSGVYYVEIQTDLSIIKRVKFIKK